MNILHKSLLVLLGCLAALLLGAAPSAQARPTEAQMRALLPGPAELPGYGDIEPEGNNPGTMYKETPAPPRHRPRRVKLGLDLSTQDRGLSGFADRVSAPLYTADGRFMISMAANLCDSAATADALMENWRAACSAPAREGSVSSDRILGDRSLVINTTVVCRLGALHVAVRGGLPHAGSRKGFRGEFPPAAVDAVAHAILVRASGMTGVTGVTRHPAAVRVNGKPLPADSALLVGGTTYVRPLAFAQALGWEADWDVAKGVLTLWHPQWHPARRLVLPAVPGPVDAPITVPLWIDQGQPMMLLTDLVQTVGGRLTRGADGVFQITR